VSGARLLDLGAVAPLRSQALYHGLAERMTEEAPDTLVLCRPARPYFSVGYHQAPERELDLDWCRGRGYPVIRRRIGGGTVFLDSSQLFYQCIVHRRRAPFAVEAIYRRYLMPAVRTLRGLGLQASLEGVNEIEVGGRRVAGTGGGQIAEAVVVVGNLLFDFPAAIMGRAWRAPSRAYRRLAADGLARHLATLGDLLPACPSEAEIRRRLVAEYADALGRPLEPGRLDPDERDAIRREERRLARLDPAGPARPGARPGLKVTRRVWVHEWVWGAGRARVRVTARVASGRVEAMEVAGKGMAREEAERRVLEALQR
jgi:lipoate-protein ligase A